jgi:hypothetical protein
MPILFQDGGAYILSIYHPLHTKELRDHFAHMLRWRIDPHPTMVRYALPSTTLGNHT